MRFIKFLLVLLSVMLLLGLAYWATDEFFEPKAYNYMVKTFTAHKQGDKDIVLIVIDDKSIGRYRWPWKRELYCPIFNYFREYTNCRAIVYDSIFVTKDIENPASDKKYLECLSRVDNLITGAQFSSKEYENKLAGEKYDKKFEKKFAVDIEDLRSDPDDYILNSVSLFPDEYFRVIDKVGFLNMARNADGYVTATINGVKYKNDVIYPSLALRAYMFVTKEDKIIITDSNVAGVKTKIKIPTITDNDEKDMVSLIRYYKPNSAGSGYTHKTYSAIDIMDSYDELKKGKTPVINPKEFDNKIVMVGANVKATATGLSDIKRSPVSTDHSGLDIQATILDNYLNNYFMIKLPKWLNFLVSIFLMSLTFIVIRRFKLFAALSTISLFLVAYISDCAVLYYNGYAANTLTPVTMSVITMIFAYSYKYILEDKNKEKIKTAMGKYISEDIMKNVVKNIDELKLGGKKANVTVLFADIRGFTSMSEKLSADEVSVILNEYFTEIEPIVTRHNGVINKFIGDAVMAIFGEPIQDENHPKNAVRCACEMLDKVKELQAKWLEEGKPKIEIGIGINTGEAFVGNIGSEKRMEYTVIGDMVNLASRIEGNNKTFKTNLLISESTYNSARGIVDTVKISNVKIRGKEKELNLYEVIRLIG